MDPTTDDAPAAPPRPGAGLGTLVVAVGTLLAIGAIIGIPIYNASDDRWRPQAEAFMTTFVDAGGEGSHERFMQLNGFIEDTRDHLSGEYRVTGLDMDESLALVGEAAENAGYASECRPTTFEHVEGRIADDAQRATSLQQCLLSEGRDGRGWVVVAVFDSEALFNIEAGHDLANYWP